MLKQIYYKNLPCGVGAPTSVKLPIQVLGLKVGEETPQDIEFTDITKLKVRLKKGGSTGVGAELTTEGVDKYAIEGNTITITLGSRNKNDMDEVSIVGQYGNVGVYAVIKLFYKSGQNEFTLNPYIIRVTDGGTGGGGGGGIIEGTYEEIKDLRDVGKLSVGSWYRITDFVTTTTQENTQSAQHPFDILVLATDVNQFSEHARAMHHVGDTYFSTANIEAWDIWYCFDNDTNRFYWADEENGKGVIWRMVDEWNNDCPYDFKNILYLYDGQYYYTFDHNTSGIHVDLSVFGNDKSIFTTVGGCHGNIMLEYIKEQGLRRLNFNIFRNSGSTYCFNNVLGSNCFNNVFGDKCNNNIIGNNCHSNVFGFYFCQSVLGNYCTNNIIKNECTNFLFGNNCSYNTFGNNCSYNIFGNVCHHNTFSNDCSSNTFGNSCSYIIFGTSETALKSYMQYITIESGVQYCNITCSATTSSSIRCKNIHVNSGVNNTTTKKTITITTANNAFLTTVGTANDTKINV